MEEAVTGKRLDNDAISKAAEAAVKNAQPLKHNAYKVPLFRGLLK